MNNFARLLESTQRWAFFYKAKNKKWYLELAQDEHGEQEDSDTFGPFKTEDAARDFLNNFSNPGGSNTDKSGKRPVPKKSPNGSKVTDPRTF